MLGFSKITPEFTKSFNELSTGTSSNGSCNTEQLTVSQVIIFSWFGDDDDDDDRDDDDDDDDGLLHRKSTYENPATN